MELSACLPLASAPFTYYLRHHFLIVVAVRATGLRESAIAVLQAVAAAADTTRVTLFTVLALVAMSPRVQEEIFAEQQKVREL